jgi:hypothetical protein
MAVVMLHTNKRFVPVASPLQPHTPILLYPYTPIPLYPYTPIPLYPHTPIPLPPSPEFQHFSLPNIGNLLLIDDAVSVYNVIVTEPR